MKRRMRFRNVAPGTSSVEADADDAISSDPDSEPESDSEISADPDGDPDEFADQLVAEVEVLSPNTHVDIIRALIARNNLHYRGVPQGSMCGCHLMNECGICQLLAKRQP